MPVPVPVPVKYMDYINILIDLSSLLNSPVMPP